MKPPRLYAHINGVCNSGARNERGARRLLEVDAAEAFEPAATAEKWPKGEYFILDVQSHFTNASI